MEIAELLSEDRIVLGLRVRDKRSLIAELARLIAPHAVGVSATEIEQALLMREQLGSTGLGSGFALPHARLGGLAAFVGLFVRLARPVDFDAIDDKPVDTVFVLLIPDSTADHVAVLAAITRRFRDADLRAAVRSAATPAEIARILTQR